MRAGLVVAGVALALVAASAAADELDQHGQAHAWQGPAPGYTVIDFAASWCAPCRAALPRLEAFARAHPALRILVVSVDERREGRDELVASLHLTLPVLWDEGHHIAERYQPEGMPATLVLDPGGRVVYRHVGAGARAWERFVAFVDALAPPA